MCYFDHTAAVCDELGQLVVIQLNSQSPTHNVWGDSTDKRLDSKLSLVEERDKLATNRAKPKQQKFRFRSSDLNPLMDSIY